MFSLCRSLTLCIMSNPAIQLKTALSKDSAGGDAIPEQCSTITLRRVVLRTDAPRIGLPSGSPMCWEGDHQAPSLWGLDSRISLSNSQMRSFVFSPLLPPRGFRFSPLARAIGRLRSDHEVAPQQADVQGHSIVKPQYAPLVVQIAQRERTLTYTCRVLASHLGGVVQVVG